jgi:hypothetical protein
MDILVRQHTLASSNIFDNNELKRLKKIVQGILPQNHFVKSSIERNPNKTDYCMLKTFEKLVKSSTPRLYGIIKKMKQDIMTATNVYFKHSWHVMVTGKGYNEQEWHYDNSRTRNYYTIIIPLTNDSIDQGGTEFKEEIQDTNGSIYPPNTPLNVYKGVVVFRGTVMHRGTQNNYELPRIFLYMPLFIDIDPNEI